MRRPFPKSPGILGQNLGHGGPVAVVNGASEQDQPLFQIALISSIASRSTTMLQFAFRLLGPTTGLG
jgi:hypothetical protein